MPREVNAIGIAAEARRIAVNPDNGTSYLLDHREEAAACIVDVDKIKNDMMCPGLNKKLGLQGIVGRAIAAPSAAMNEYVNRRICLCRAKYVELFDLARAIGEPQRRTDNRARPIAVGDTTLDDLCAIGCVFLLIVCVVERLLVQIEPDGRALDLFS